MTSMLDLVEKLLTAYVAVDRRIGVLGFVASKSRLCGEGLNTHAGSIAYEFKPSLVSSCRLQILICTSI